MQDIGTYFRDYAAYHQTKGNKVTHVVGIPLIIMAGLGLLNHISFLHPAILVWLLGNIFYLRLHATLGLTMVVSTALLYILGTLLPIPVLVGLFIVGWILQLVGHSIYEKKKPLFLKNLTHLMIGPVFIQNYFLKIYR